MMFWLTFLCGLCRTRYPELKRTQVSLLQGSGHVANQLLMQRQRASLAQQWLQTRLDLPQLRLLREDCDYRIGKFKRFFSINIQRGITFSSRTFHAAWLARYQGNTAISTT